ncbi:Fic family protein [Desulfosporosinus sp. FKB]|uniref:Fic family protein n=1 Tax=Desulfosporosinus sp. FKB TaxID=1969835 RepID=UPI000B4A173A|nr:Fic family protein [Desulfosporosinus sp. FKB]
MMSFRNDKLQGMTWSNETMQLISRIQEYKGKQGLFKQQQPEVLSALQKSAIIQSTESSNRLEGIIVSAKRLNSIVNKNAMPQNRLESEVAGYRDVLATIHTSAVYMNIKSGIILQLHRDLMQYATESGGRYKTSENEITETLPDGTKRVRFIPVPAWKTAEAVDELIASFLREREQGTINELILIAAFILDVLCIHPFPDGNGRLARLLTLLLLYQTGHEVGRYISLEKIVEETKNQYYETLEQSSKSWHDGNHDLKPWLNYFLVVILKSYQKFEERVGQITCSDQRKGWKAQKVQDVIDHFIADFTIHDIQDNAPGVSRPTIQRILNRLGQEGIIECIERGRNARWRKL